MKRWQLVVALLLMLVVLLGCSAPAAPLQSGTLAAPWQDGEESYYNIQTADGTLVGTAFWKWIKTGTGWTQAYEVDLTSRVDKGETTLDASLAPLSSWRTIGETRFEVLYQPADVVITSTVGTTVTTKTLPRSNTTFDNDQTLQIHRAFPLANGFTTSYLNVIPTNAASAEIAISVDGPVTLTVPAGQFSAWHMTMRIGSVVQEAWYGVEQPKLLVRYLNNGGVSFELRAWRASAGASLQGSTDAETPPDLVATPPTLTMNWPYMLLSLFIQIPIMIGISLLVGMLIHRRLGVPWKIFLFGAATFIASQVIHIPLNWLLGLIGTGQSSASTWPLPLTALVAGASAGLSEQGANWIALRFVWRKITSYAEGLQFGAGHGAVEAIVTGVAVLVTLVNILVLYFSGTANLGLTADQTREVVQAFSQVLGAPLYLPFLAALERVCALAVQILMAVLVLKSVTQRKPLYWLAAFGLHTALDAWAVYGSQTYGVVITEAGILLLAVLAVWLLWRMREPTKAKAF